MKNKLFALLLLSVFPCLLAGCNKPVMQSMGTAPMPIYHEPRWTGEQDKKIVVSADAFVTPYGEGLNVDDVFSVGGALSLQYRFWNPLFVQVAFAGAYGNLNFACTETPCTSEYNNWRTKYDDDKYDFFALQERVLLGSDFLIAGFVQTGFGAGVQFFQASGQYEDEREKLEGRDLVENANGKNEIYPVVGYWLSFHLGRNARLGLIKNEVEMSLSSDLPDGGVVTVGSSYYHPSGFHGGVSITSQMGVMFQLVKSFAF